MIKNDQPPETMILESVVTTCDRSGKVNVAPMGPEVSRDLTSITLKPFKSSQTYSNLMENPCAVVHVVDDVLLIAKAAIGRLDSPPPLQKVDDHLWRLEDACRWFAVRIAHWDGDNSRPHAKCEIIEQGRGRDFFGLNRAKHAVLEAAILATRTHILPKHQIQSEFERLKPLIEKTAGRAESDAFALLESFVADQPG